MRNAPTSPSQPTSAPETPEPEVDVARLTRRMVKGEDMAYREFHSAYFDRLLRYLLVVTRGNEQTTRDALQETFRRVVKHIRAFDEEPVFWSWLTVVARSSVADEQRRARRYMSFLDRFRHHPAITPPGVDTAYARVAQSLKDALAVLPADDRTLVELKYYEHLPVKEIARQLDTTEGAVESRLVRIRRHLKATVVANLTDEA